MCCSRIRRLLLPLVIKDMSAVLAKDGCADLETDRRPRTPHRKATPTMSGRQAATAQRCRMQHPCWTCRFLAMSVWISVYHCLRWTFEFCGTCAAAPPEPHLPCVTCRCEIARCLSRFVSVIRQRMRHQDNVMTSAQVRGGRRKRTEFVQLTIVRDLESADVCWQKKV